MKIIKIPTWYYKQFDADYSLKHPTLGYGSWHSESLDINLSKTAFVVMHAWNPFEYENNTGCYRAVEYLPRAKKILETTLPSLLSALRKNKLKIYHIVDEKHTKFTSLPNPIKDEVILNLETFKKNNVFPGKHNLSDCNKFKRQPMLIKSNEPLLYNGEELHRLCLKDGINHLIYSGFALNWCLQYSPGNMNEMSDRGFMCSTFKETITAVENKESIINEGHKEYALWLTSIKNGFIYSLPEFLSALEHS